MEQLIFHLIGDYVTQTDYQAKHKTTNFFYALRHAAIYGFPFIFIVPSALAWFVIVLTHAVIDRYRLAKYVVFFKNWVSDPSIRWKDCNITGYPNTAPIWLTTWLMIIADNTLHLAINYAAIRWL